MRKQIPTIYLNLLFIIIFFSSYPACHNLIADLDETEWNKWFTKRYLHSSDLYLMCHSAPNPPQGDTTWDCRGAGPHAMVLSLGYRQGVLQHELAWASWSVCSKQHQVTDLCCLYSRVRTYGINKMTSLKTWVVLFPFHFVAVTNKTHKGTCLSQPKCTEDHFCCCQPLSSPLWDRLCVPLASIQYLPLNCMYSGSTLHYPFHSLNNTKQPPPPKKRHLWLDGVRF